MIKKSIMIGLMICSIMMLQLGVFALSPESVSTEELIGLSFTEPVLPSESRGTTPPFNSPWYVSTQGRCILDGSSNSYALYTNNYFTGQTAYAVQIHNSHDEATVVVTFKTLTSTLRTLTLTPGETYRLRFSTLTANSEITANTNWYIMFSAPCDIYGYVDVWTG